MRKEIMDDKELTNVIYDNKFLIYSIINKYGGNFNKDDLYQVSVIGIIKAYKNFDKGRGIKFSTYAYKYILSEVLQYINDSKLIKTSREYRILSNKIMEARNVLTQRIMKEPSNLDLAIYLGIEEKVIDDVMKYREKVKSLDDIITNNGNVTFMETIPIDYNPYNEDLIQLRDIIRSLSYDEQELVRLRFFSDMTQSEVAKIRGTNQVQVSRNEKRVLKKIKNSLVCS